MFARFIWLRLLVLMVPLAFCGCPSGGSGGGGTTDTTGGDVADDQSTADDVTEDAVVADAVQDATEDGSVADAVVDVVTDTITPPDTPPDGPPPDGPPPDGPAPDGPAPDGPAPFDALGDAEPNFPPCPDSLANRCRTPAAEGIDSCPTGTVDIFPVRGVLWDDDLVVIRNRSGATVNVNGWYLRHYTDQFVISASDLDVPDMGRLYIHTNADAPGSPEEGHYYLGAGTLDLENVDEIAVFDSTNAIHGFVLWGAPPRADSAISAARTADMWPDDGDGFVIVCDEADGIVVTGAVCEPTGFHSQPHGDGPQGCETQWTQL